MGTILGIDIGGTFTDCVALQSDGSIQIGKSLSTPPDFETGFVDAIKVVAETLGAEPSALLRGTDGILHGCTVASNALIERRTARVGLLTSRGHGDSIFTMQSGRRLRALPPHAIAHVAGHVKPDPLVPKHLVRELDERVTVDGEVLAELDPTEVRRSVEELLEQGIEALACSLLWSVANDSHERLVIDIVRNIAPQVYMSTASRVVARTGEYERTVATVVNALIGPEMNRYLSLLEDHCRDLGYEGEIDIMTCSGGLISTDEARTLPLLTIGSGPAAGLIGARKLATAASTGPNGCANGCRSNVITADMGGTTLDVGVIHAGVPLSRSTSWYDQYEYFTPTLDVRSVGSGGGSIIRFDQLSGTLRVGPQSAGSRPGPVCYGRGGERPTVTDADLVAGFLNPDYFLGGKMHLDLEEARSALASVGEPLGLDAQQAARAALRIVDNQMADAIRLVTVNQGLDPREFTLYACGGAGPVHAAAIAAELGIRRIVVPLSDLASGWSAIGVARAEPIVVEETAHPMREPFDSELLNQLWRELESTASKRLRRNGVPVDQIELSRHVDMRYSLQVNEVEVDAPGGDYGSAAVEQLIARFEREYERRYGPDSGYSAAGYAITGLRVRGRGPTRAQVLPRATEPESGDGPGPSGQRTVAFHMRASRPESTAIYDDRVVRAATIINGPVVVELPDTSIVVPREAVLGFDAQGSASIYLDANRGASPDDQN